MSALTVPASSVLPLAAIAASQDITDPSSLTSVSAEQRIKSMARAQVLHERWERFVSKEQERSMRSSNPQADIPPQVRAIMKLADREVSKSYERMLALKAQKPSLPSTQLLSPAELEAYRQKLGFEKRIKSLKDLLESIDASLKAMTPVQVFSSADQRDLAIAAACGHEGAKELLLWADPTMCQVTMTERAAAARRSADLFRRYQARLSLEQRQGARSRDEDMLYPQQIRAATWLDGKNQYLPKEDQRLLAIAAKLGDDRAKTVLLMSNQHQAIKTAKRVQRKDASLHDMVQSTNVGLLHAIQLYDPHNDRGASFLTFATWHGWQRAMRDGQLSGRTGLSVPPYMDQYCDLVRKVRLQLQQSEQRNEHDMDELLHLVNEGRSRKNLIEMEELERAVSLLEVNYQPLDSGWADEEDGRSFSEQIGIEETESVIGSMDHQIQCQQLQKWLRSILGDTYDLYVRNQGLFGHEVESVADISDASQLTDKPLSRNQVALRVRSAKKLVSHHIDRGSISLAA